MKRIFKKFFGKYKSNVRDSLIDPIDLFVLRVSSYSKILSSIYIFLGSSFSREQYSVVNGRLKYLQRKKKDNINMYILIRNVHRIEKGLIMRPRKEIFALNYIEETISILEELVKNREDTYESQVKWIIDVLNEYFSVININNNDKVLKLKERFNELQSELKQTLTEGRFIPYQRNITSPVNFDNLLQLSMERRSVRWYEQKEVPRELIDKAFQIAKLSPSACNRQPFEFRIIDDGELIKKILSNPLGTTGFKNNIPVLVVVIGDLSAFYLEHDRHVIYIDSALSTMSFVYALETLGLSSCIINWPDAKENEKHIVEVLGLPPEKRVIMLTSLGYPDKSGMVPFSGKKSLNDIRTYNLE